jgi:hypothetical protein
MDLEVGELQQGAELVMLDPESHRVVSLNAAAAAIWYLCDGRRDLAGLADEVCSSLPGVERAEAIARLEGILGQLSELQLLEA